MFRPFWRSLDRFSLQNFKYIINELQGISNVDTFNEEVVVDLLQSVVEIVSYGDKHDPLIFECFMEHQVLADFVRMLNTCKSSRIQAKVLQYLSILIQNVHSEHGIYYCFSNGYINNIITHEYEFHAGDLVLYYVSFLRAVSAKLNRDTICLLLEVQEHTVTSFPLYTKALRFAHHGEKMIQIAIRSLTLCIYNVSDDVVFQYLMTPPVSEYFSDLVLKLKEECVHLDSRVSSIRNNNSADKREDLSSATDRILDYLYYLKDLLSVGKSCLTNIVIEKLLDLLVVPLMMQLMQLGGNDVCISPITSMYLLSLLLQVLDKKEILDSVACLILYPHLCANEAGFVDSINVKPSLKHLTRIEQTFLSSLDSQEVFQDKMLGQERNGILSYVFSDELCLPLSSLMLLLVLAESDLDNLLATALGFPQTHPETDDAVVSEQLQQSILVKFMPQILNVLFGILGTKSPCPVLQWHVGWFVLQLINMQISALGRQQLHHFNVSIQLNSLRHQARERLLTELTGCWFDYITETFKQEWDKCRSALETSSKKKDPLFLLEISVGKQSSDGNGIDAWQRMVDVVKIFVLQLQLKAFVSKGYLPDCPLRNSQSSSLAIPKNGYASDALSATFGSEVSLASGIPCTIAFPRVGLRNIYMIPVATEISGKLLLVEKHPFHSRRGIVFATAPLAGLKPKIDEAQPTWLHLSIRDFAPKLLVKKGSTKSSTYQTDARWSLGFPDVETCEAASSLIGEETCKQRSFVENLLAPVLYDSYPRDYAALRA